MYDPFPYHLFICSTNVCCSLCCTSVPPEWCDHQVASQKGNPCLSDAMVAQKKHVQLIENQQSFQLSTPIFGQIVGRAISPFPS